MSSNLALFRRALNSGGKSPVCVTSSAVKIPDETLVGFTGKRVRIFAHNDAAGQQAAATWMSQLQGVFATVDVFDFTGLERTDDQPVNDLNDLSLVNYDCWEVNRPAIEAVMHF